jgi:hypothetical protein
VLLLHFDQLDSRLGAVGQLDDLRFAAIEVDSAEERLVRRLVPHTRLGNREGGDECDYNWE